MRARPLKRMRAQPFEGHSMRRLPLLTICALALALFSPAPSGRAQAPARPPPEADNYTLTLPGGPPPATLGSGTVQFIGSATVLIRYQGFTILADPNFIHRGERIHLGYGMTSERLTEPALDFDALPPVDLVILSHLHEDHFDLLVQQKLRHDIPIVTTPEASERLGQLGFRQRYALGRWDSLTVRKGEARVRITALPARHGPRGVTAMLPTVMGSMIDFGDGPTGTPYRIYISGDTLVYDDIAEIGQRFPDIDLALMHLGGERLLGLVTVSMDGAEGVRMLRMLGPRVAIPLHFDDYGIYKSPLSDFEAALSAAAMRDKVVILQRGQAYGFSKAPQ
jgi:L-ascorbate metabolism protein UlaG (beta-lactamase superfamily)